MPRRRELKSIASGLAAHCLCRNNDISGYWAVGIIHRLAQEEGVKSISISVMEASSSSSVALRSFKSSIFKRLQTNTHSLIHMVEACEVTFQFEPHSWLASRGQCCRVTCIVDLIDDLGKRRSASGTTYSYPHDPRFESRSTRARLDPYNQPLDWKPQP